MTQKFDSEAADAWQGTREFLALVNAVRTRVIVENLTAQIARLKFGSSIVGTDLLREGIRKSTTLCSLDD